MTFWRRKINALYAIFACSFIFSSLAVARVQHALGGKTGMIMYTIQGFKNESGTNAMNFTAEWNYFVNSASSVIVGYRSATNQEEARALYHETYLGTRIFPMTLGIPINSTIATSTVNYRFAFKPFVDTGVAFGRYSIPLVGLDLDTAVFDIASDFIGLFVGGGFFYTLWGNLNVEMNLTYENMTGYNSPVAFDGSNIYVMLGFNYNF